MVREIREMKVPLQHLIIIFFNFENTFRFLRNNFISELLSAKAVARLYQQAS